MKIRKLENDNHTRVTALLKQAFPDSNYEVQLVENLRKNKKPIHEWVCILRGRVVGYIAFSNAYYRAAVCGLHLGPLAVAPPEQNCGVGSELVRYALRQEAIMGTAIFVLGNPKYYQRFGFELCALPICPFDKSNEHFLSIRNNTTSRFTIGYEPEFKEVRTAAKNDSVTHGIHNQSKH